MKKMGSLDHLPRPARVAILERAGMPTMEAIRTAGYATGVGSHAVKSTSTYKRYRDAIQDDRIVIATKRGYRIQDSAKWYRDTSNDDDAPAAARIRARECLDKLLGYFAPVEVDQSGTGGSQAPVIQFLQVLADSRVSPAELLQAVQSGEDAPGIDAINDQAKRPGVMLENVDPTENPIDGILTGHDDGGDGTGNDDDNDDDIDKYI